jgi:hypothetical protein
MDLSFQKNKIYYIGATICLIVAILLLTGGGDKGEASPKDMCKIAFKLDSYEELMDENSQAESVSLTGKEYKAKISVDPLEVESYDAFIDALKHGKSSKVEAFIMIKDSSLLNQDEIVPAYAISIAGKDYMRLSVSAK